MPAYQGGKARQGKSIAAFIVGVKDAMLPHGGAYYEPFLGMGGVMCHIPKDVERHGSDINESVVLFWQAVQEGWRPEYVSWGDHEAFRAAAPSADKAFAMTAMSFSGRWAAPYVGRYTDAEPFYNRGLRSIERRDMSGVRLSHSDYRDVDVEEGSVVYLDPPYAGTTGYGGRFDHEEFWARAREWATHSLVFVSEHSAPDDFVPVWSRSVSRRGNGRNARRSATQRRTEMLFVHSSLAEVLLQ